MSLGKIMQDCSRLVRIMQTIGFITVRDKYKSHGEMEVMGHILGIYFLYLNESPNQRIPNLPS